MPTEMVSASVDKQWMHGHQSVTKASLDMQH